MNLRKNATTFIRVFVVTFLVSLVVTFLWGLVFHGAGIIDWETSLRFATVLGIIFPIINSRKRMKPGK